MNLLFSQIYILKFDTSIYKRYFKKIYTFKFATYFVNTIYKIKKCHPAAKNKIKL